MSYGKLTVYAGPMFSSKSTGLLQKILWFKNGMNASVLVIKPSFDDRYSETEIVNHDGLKAPAISVTNLTEVFVETHQRLVALDEVQFFVNEKVSTNDIVDWIKNLLQQGKDVVVSGLDMDWKGHPFPITGMLLAMADEGIKKQAYCTICGKPAAKTYKKAAEGGSIELGGTDKYEARCNFHWKT